MSTSIDTAFVRQYETEVAMVFQRQGGYLRPSVRTKDGVRGTSTTFQKIGKGVATTKARHGVITPMNQDHTAVTCTLADFYAGDWVDKLDEAKINHDERMAIATGGAWALGRQVDNQILLEMANTSQTAVTWAYGSVAQVENSLINSLKALDNGDVPNDGNRYVVLSPKSYAAAMKVTSFASADYVAPGTRPTDNGQPIFTWRRWMGANWTSHTGVAGKDTATCKGFAYHKNALGYATGIVPGTIGDQQMVGADITWHGDRAAWFINHMMSGGAKLIDDTGCFQLTLDDTAVLPLILATV